MEHMKSVMGHLQAGCNNIGRSLVDEMNELGRLRTAIMMEKCSKKNDVVACPKPMRQTSSFRPIGELNEHKTAANLSNILVNKASPPYFSGSPPMRSGNPLIHDAHFQEQSTPSRSSNCPTHTILSIA